MQIIITHTWATIRTTLSESLFIHFITGDHINIVFQLKCNMKLQLTSSSVTAEGTFTFNSFSSDDGGGGTSGIKVVGVTGGFGTNHFIISGFPLRLGLLLATCRK